MYIYIQFLEFTSYLSSLICGIFVTAHQTNFVLPFVLAEVGALTEVNRAVTACSVNETMTALQHPALKLSSLCCQDALHYYQLLKVRNKQYCKILITFSKC